MPSLRVSIVTPSLNQAGFITETIESVLSQDYPNIEYIVMDGGSADGTLAIIEKYSRHLAYWESGPDKGQADAINRGMARATGDILAYLNSDDVLVPGAVQAIVEGFSLHPDAGVIYGATEKIDEHGCVVKPPFLTPYSKKLHKTLCLVPQPSSFYSRAAWEQHGPFDTSLHYVLDWDFLLKVEKTFSIVAIDTLISRFRVYSSTKSASGGWPRLEEIARISHKHNGFWNYNYLVYLALRLADRLEKKISFKSRPLRRLVMKAATTLRDGRTFMLHDNA